LPIIDGTAPTIRRSLPDSSKEQVSKMKYRALIARTQAVPTGISGDVTGSGA
jgi:hypothetical protein